ncbi:structural maintenance of chromosomes protein 5-like [Amblyomma americanum]
MAKAALENLQKRLAASRREVVQKRREAQEATKCPSTTKQIPPELIEEFRALPKTAKEVNDQLLFEEQALSCMLPADASVEREYLQCRAAVSRLEKEVAGSEHQLSLARAEMAETGARWLDDVEELLQRVNISFGRFFCELGCVGEYDVKRTTLATFVKNKDSITEPFDREKFSANSK